MNKYFYRGTSNNNLANTVQNFKRDFLENLSMLVRAIFCPHNCQMITDFNTKHQL